MLTPQDVAYLETDSDTEEFYEEALRELFADTSV